MGRFALPRPRSLFGALAVPVFGLVMVSGIPDPQPSAGAILPVPGLAVGARERSVGCDATPPAAPLAAVWVDGRKREVVTGVPDDYDPTQPHALVVAFHGRTNAATKVRDYFSLEPHASRPTIFVYPTGLRAGRGYSWSDPRDSPDRLRDYALFDEILAQAEALYCIDPRRVFVVGHSLGAWFANSLGCARSEVVRGVGAVAGGISVSNCAEPVAAAVLHNPSDRLVPFRQGLFARDHYLERNGLLDAPTSLLSGELSCSRHGDAEARDPLIWCPHHRDRTHSGRYYPHLWPDETAALLLGFFESLP